jgi:hypothetical protein
MYIKIYLTISNDMKFNKTFPLASIIDDKLIGQSNQKPYISNDLEIISVLNRLNPRA